MLSCVVIHKINSFCLATCIQTPHLKINFVSRPLSPYILRCLQLPLSLQMFETRSGAVSFKLCTNLHCQKRQSLLRTPRIKEKKNTKLEKGGLQFALLPCDFQ